MKIHLIKFNTVLFLLLSIFTIPHSRADSTLNWEDLNRKIERKFPQSRWITIEELKSKLKNGEKIAIIDVRETEEFNVSHLKNAVHIEAANKIRDAFKNFDGIVVLYCAAGYRSGKIADKLTRAGMKNVFNLKGSIFEWANGGGKLFQRSRETFFVHPYNRYWGRLLYKKYHRYK